MELDVTVRVEIEDVEEQEDSILALAREELQAHRYEIRGIRLVEAEK